MILKHTALFTILATTVVLAGCNDKDNDSSKIVSPKILKIGSTGQSYPNGFKQNGKLVGFDVETTEAIAKELGYTIEWTTAEFSGLMGQLDSGRLDTVANAVAVTEARKTKYDFTQPYSYYGSQLVAHKDNSTINILDDFKGKTISGVLGSNHLKNLQKRFPNNEVNVKTYETRDGAMYDLVYKRVDGYINSKPILLAEIKRGNLPFKLVGEPLVIEEVAFPFAKNEKGEELRKEFNQAIKKLKERGNVKELSIKYYGEDITASDK